LFICTFFHFKIINDNLKLDSEIGINRGKIDAIFNLELSKSEGEKVSQYEQRVVEAFDKIFD